MVLRLENTWANHVNIHGIINIKNLDSLKHAKMSSNYLSSRVTSYITISLVTIPIWPTSNFKKSWKYAFPAFYIIKYPILFPNIVMNTEATSWKPWIYLSYLWCPKKLSNTINTSLWRFFLILFKKLQMNLVDSFKSFHWWQRAFGIFL